MSAIQLIKNGETVNLEDHPSLLALLHAQNRAVNALNEELMQLTDQLTELRERKQLYRKIGMRINGISRRENRIRNRIQIVERQCDIFQKGYAEIPNMDGARIETDEEWGETLSVDTPIDVIRALNHAKEQALFDEFRVVRPWRTGLDPIIVGVVGDAHFYIASWR